MYGKDWFWCPGGGVKGKEWLRWPGVGKYNMNILMSDTENIKLNA